jgi:hypothetical protein
MTYENYDFYSDDPIEETSNPIRRKFKSIFAVLVLLFGGTYLVQTTLAANIALNSGAPVEFGQGITTTVACSGSNSITINPQNSFVNVSGAGDFYFSGIKASGIPAGCTGILLSFSAYTNSGSSALAIFGGSSTTFEITPTGSSFTTLNSGVTLSELTSTSFTATFDTPVQLASAVAKLTVQSATDANYSNMGSISFGAVDSLEMTSMTPIGTSPYTAETWVKLTTAHTASGLIFSGSNSLAIYIEPARGQIRIVKWGVGTGQQIFYIPTLSLNTWYHIAVVRDSSNRTQLFLNGTKSDLSYVTDASDYSGGVAAIFAAGAGGKLIGKLSNLRITNTAVYDPTASTITVPTAPLTAVAGTLLLLNTTRSNPFLDSSSSPLTVTTSGSPSSSTENPFN